MSKWKETELAKIGTVVSGGTPSTSVSAFWNGNILFVTPYDLSRNTSPYIADTERKLTEEGVRNSSATLLPAGSIVLSSRAPIGYVAIGKSTFTTNQGCKSLIPSSDFDSLFLYYDILFYVERIKRLGAGSTFSEISKSDLETVAFPHPVLKDEQKKIAKILSTIDAVIEKTKTAIEKYKAIKQGMLHDLFTRGIDLKTGKLRPKYEDAPELYKESKLGWIPREWEFPDIEDAKVEIIDGDRGVNYPKEFIESGYCLFLSAANVTKDGFRFDKRLFISQEKDDALGTGKLKRMDIVVTTRGTVGNVAYYNLEIPYRDVRINSGMVIMRNLSTDINSQYLYHYIKEFLFGVVYKKVLSGSAQPQLPIKDLKKFLVLKPLPKEQEVISDKLSNMSSILFTEQTYLHKLQQVKQGLMSDLLSGRKRVKVKETNPAHLLSPKTNES